MKRFIVACLIVLTVSHTATGKHNLSHLKVWANEYPSLSKKRSIFAVPEVRRPLLRLLGRDGFAKLTSTFSTQAPIDVIEGFLVLEGWKPASYPAERALIAIDLNNGDFYVCLITGDVPRWVSTKERIVLPDCIVGRLKD